MLTASESAPRLGLRGARDRRIRDIRGRDIRGRDIRGRDIRGRDERGSVALVVMVIFVMATLAAVMVSRNAGDLRRSVTEEHQAAADAAADLGIARAVARVQGGESTKRFTDEGSTGAASWAITAALVEDGQWQLVSTGNSDSSSRSVSAVLVRRSDQFWAVTGWHQISSVDAARPVVPRRESLSERRRRLRQGIETGDQTQDLLKLFR